MDFVNEDVIRQLLKSEASANEITILAHEINNNVVEEGGNFCSQASQMTVRYEREGETYSKSYFLKIPSSSRLYEIVKQMGMYKKEVLMYESVLPRLQPLLLPGEYFAPLHHYTHNDEILILEDLAELGYRICPRHSQLDFQHSAMSLKYLAKFHAASVKVDELTPEILSAAKEELIYTTNRILADGFRPAYEDDFLVVVRRADPSFANTNVQALSHFAKHGLLQSTVRELEPQRYSFNVLNHGDFWTNNIMFKYDEHQNVERVKFVDYQLCRWCSPASDILHLAITSIRFETFETHFDSLLQIYVDELNHTLKRLNCKRAYEIDDLRKDLQNMYNVWIFSLIFHTPRALSEPLDDDTEIVHYNVLKGKYYTEVSKKWMTYFIRNGYLNLPPE